jgi:hypothetical protein
MEIHNSVSLKSLVSFQLKQEKTEGGETLGFDIEMKLNSGKSIICDGHDQAGRTTNNVNI